jgi:hypothetical protein
VVNVQGFQRLTQHGQIEACRPTEALQPGEEACRRNHIALLVHQPGQNLAVDEPLRLDGAHHRLEVQLEQAILQCTVE